MPSSSAVSTRRENRGDSVPRRPKDATRGTQVSRHTGMFATTACRCVQRRDASRTRRGAARKRFRRRNRRCPWRAKSERTSARFRALPFLRDAQWPRQINRRRTALGMRLTLHTRTHRARSPSVSRGRGEVRSAGPGRPRPCRGCRGAQITTVVAGRALSKTAPYAPTFVRTRCKLRGDHSGPQDAHDVVPGVVGLEQRPQIAADGCTNRGAQPSRTGARCGTKADPESRLLRDRGARC